MYPGASNTELVPHALLHRRAALPGRPGARRPSRCMRRVRGLLAALPPRRWPDELARLRRPARLRAAVRRRTASSSELPWLFEGAPARPEPRHGRTARACDAIAARSGGRGAARMRRRATAVSSTAASRAATSRASYGKAAERRACRAAGDVLALPTWTRRRPPCELDAALRRADPAAAATAAAGHDGQLGARAMQSR